MRPLDVLLNSLEQTAQLPIEESLSHRQDLRRALLTSRFFESAPGGLSKRFSILAGFGLIASVVILILIPVSPPTQEQEAPLLRTHPRTPVLSVSSPAHFPSNTPAEDPLFPQTPAFFPPASSSIILTSSRVR